MPSIFTPGPFTLLEPGLVMDEANGTLIFWITAWGPAVQLPLNDGSNAKVLRPALFCGGPITLNSGVYRLLLHLALLHSHHAQSPQP